MAIGSMLPAISNDCIRINLTNDGSTISNLPLNINILSFTLGYLAYIIAVTNSKAQDSSNQIVIKNIPTLVIFSLLIIAEFVNAFIIEQCIKNPLYLVASMVIGGSFGVLFAYMVNLSGIVQLQYFNGITNQQVCTRATNAKYKCSTTPKNI
jgi:hypothetical protein